MVQVVAVEIQVDQQQVVTEMIQQLVPLKEMMVVLLKLVAVEH